MHPLDFDILVSTWWRVAGTSANLYLFWKFSNFLSTDFWNKHQISRLKKKKKNEEKGYLLRTLLRTIYRLYLVNWLFFHDVEVWVRDSVLFSRLSVILFNTHCKKLLRSFLRIWSHLLKKSWMENFIFCVVAIRFFSIKCVSLSSLDSVLQQQLSGNSKKDWTFGTLSWWTDDKTEIFLTSISQIRHTNLLYGTQMLQMFN